VNVIEQQSPVLTALREAVPGAVATEPEALRRASVDRSEWAGDGILPLAVLTPRAETEVAAIMRIASRYRVPVVPRGAGTGMSGGATALPGCLVLDLSGMASIREIDPIARTAVVEPGVINAELDRAAAEYGLAFAPDPASSAISTVGGNIATNAGGLRCVKYGATRQSVLGLRVVLASGEIVELGGRTRKNVTGLDLLGLLVGSEGSLGVIVEATVALIPRPVAQRMIVAACADIDALQRCVIAASTASVTPSVFELMDRASIGEAGGALLQRLSLSADAAGILILQTDGAGSDAEIHALADAVAAAGAEVSAVLAEEEAVRVMAMRRGEAALGTGDRQIVSKPDRWWLGEDMTIPASELAAFLVGSERVARAHGVSVSLIAHVGDGNLHPSITLPRGAASREEARETLHEAADELIRMARDAGGALTGEHGVGTAKRRWLPLFVSPTVTSLNHSVKAAFDPGGILNPGRAF
jgi:glycolate oxidase